MLMPKKTKHRKVQRGRLTGKANRCNTVHFGTYGSNNSSVEAWAAMDGGGYKQFVNIKNATLQKDGPSPADKYNELTFTPYMTNLSSAASANAYVWYDELIVSTLPIAAPGSGGGVTNPPPAAPTNLRVQ